MDEILKQAREQLAPHFKPGFLQRPSTTFQFRFDADEPMYLIVTADDFHFYSGESSAATLTIYASSHSACLALLGGRQDPMEAFMSGEYRADGHIVLSQLLLYLFKPVDASLAWEVKD